jgi:hypothetical protein
MSTPLNRENRAFMRILPGVVAALHQLASGAATPGNSINALLDPNALRSRRE